MHAIETHLHTSGIRMAARLDEGIDPAAVRASSEPVAGDRGLAAAEGGPDWLARADLLRRARRVGDPESFRNGAIRLRRARRVFAPFTALPSLARPALSLRSRRR